jgi:hypothetical protein
LRNRNGKAEGNDRDDFAGKREDDRGWRNELARMRHSLTDRAVRRIVIGRRVLLRRGFICNFRRYARLVDRTQAESLRRREMDMGLGDIALQRKGDQRQRQNNTPPAAIGADCQRNVFAARVQRFIL